MKKLVLSLTAVMCIAFTSQAQGFQFGAGAQLYDFESFGIQGKVIYDLNETIEIGGAFTYILEDFIDFEIDASAYYKGLDLGESFALYPFAGLSLLRASFFGLSATNISPHVGASFRIPGESLNFYAEVKLVLDNGSPINISGGVLF